MEQQKDEHRMPTDLCGYSSGGSGVMNTNGQAQDRLQFTVYNLEYLVECRQKQKNMYNIYKGIFSDIQFVLKLF